MKDKATYAGMLDWVCPHPGTWLSDRGGLWLCFTRAPQGQRRLRGRRTVLLLRHLLLLVEVAAGPSPPPAAPAGTPLRAHRPG